MQRRLISRLNCVDQSHEGRTARRIAFATHKAQHALQKPPGDLNRLLRQGRSRNKRITRVKPHILPAPPLRWPAPAHLVHHADAGPIAPAAQSQAPARPSPRAPLPGQTAYLDWSDHPLQPMPLARSSMALQFCTAPGLQRGAVKHYIMVPKSPRSWPISPSNPAHRFPVA
jgi:hypothetical protein